MILQALKEYYDRKALDPDSKMAPPGWEWKEIPFVLILNRDGVPVSLNSTTEGTGKNKRAKCYLIPQGVKKASGIASNLLWENPEYALGVVIKSASERVADQHQAFKQRITDLGEISDPGLVAVKKFMEQPDKASVLQVFGDKWVQFLAEGANITFQLAGEPEIIANSPLVKEIVSSEISTTGDDLAVCLITGEEDSIERLHTAIKGVWGAQSSGANIVSFNSQAFASFGKKQGCNSPIGKTAAFAYTTALNHLLGKDSKQRMQVGDASTIFWSAKPTTLEEQILDFFAEPPKDDPDRNSRAVESLFKAPQTGAILDDSEAETYFYVLGLSPNAARLSVRFWIMDTVAGMAVKIRQHFEDLRIIHGPKEHDTISLFRLLVSTAALGKSENITPNLAGDTMRSILMGTPYPQTILQSLIRRIRAEHEITYPRAALIKACLNRSMRFNNHNYEKEITMSLDTANTNVGYCLGRLFAVLERIQERANPGINATIRDRFYGAASGTPVTVFGNLMRLKNHHISKLENAGERINFEKLIGEIMSGIQDFPAHLPLANQGRFAVGYYHQKQDFFTKKTD